MAKNNWKAVWDTKGESLVNCEQPDLAQLIREDGFDSGAGDHTLQSWTAFTAATYQKMGLEPESSILEVGCGSGAFLFPAYQQGHRVCGIDYSWQLLRGAAKAMPEFPFVQAQASALPLCTNSYDLVLCHSVFQYFPTLAYAAEVVHEMLRVMASAGGRLAILDVNDAAREADFYRIRGEHIGAEEYAEKYRDYPHLFFHKKWFEDVLGAANMRVEVVDQDIPEYGNSAFRYNVYGWRA